MHRWLTRWDYRGPFAIIWLKCGRRLRRPMRRSFALKRALNRRSSTCPTGGESMAIITGKSITGGRTKPGLHWTVEAEPELGSPSPLAPGRRLRFRAAANGRSEISTGEPAVPANWRYMRARTRLPAKPATEKFSHHSIPARILRGVEDGCHGKIVERREINSASLFPVNWKPFNSAVRIWPLTIRHRFWRGLKRTRHALVNVLGEFRSLL